MSAAEAAPEASPHIVVGTAGHIDHGKTTLVRALTGIDCDRWEEEKRRGITIDIGFAHLRRDGLQIGFVDVPGHERFVRHALAGLGGIDLMMLVIAADEGIMPQTREHLDICRLLEIPAAVVALTKIDAVDPELLDVVRLEVAEELAATPFAEAPLIPVSSLDRRGLDELEEALLARAVADSEVGRRGDRPTRLPIDRAFHLQGLGVLVTGTLASGTVAAQDTLEVVPGGVTARVRNVEVHGEARRRGLAGERTALQLSGPTLEQVGRGTQLVAAGTFTESRRLAARYTHLESAKQALDEPLEARFHLYSAELAARIAPLAGPIQPGAQGLVEIRLETPLAMARGDRFVVRLPSPARTVGGGTLLDPAWKRPRRKDLQAALVALDGGDPESVSYWAARAGVAGISSTEIGRRLGWHEPRAARMLDELATNGALQPLVDRGGSVRWVATTTLDALRQRAQEVLEAFFAANRLALEMPKAAAGEKIFGRRGQALAAAYLDRLAADGIMEVRGDGVTLAGREVGLEGGESKLSQDIVAAFAAAGLTPPSPPELCRALGAKQQIFDGVLRHLVSTGRVTRLPQGLFVATAALAALERDLRGTGWQEFGVAEFKQRFGLTRKWAIPLLEHLDSRRVTARQGDRRKILPAGG